MAIENKSGLFVSTETTLDLPSDVDQLRSGQSMDWRAATAAAVKKVMQTDEWREFFYGRPKADQSSTVTKNK